MESTVRPSVLLPIPCCTNLAFFLPKSACTSAITEISYHDSTGVEAIVQFFTLDEWLNQIGLSLAEAQKKPKQDNLAHVSPWCFNLHNDFMTFQELPYQIRCVYPGLQKEDPLNFTPRQIFEQNQGNRAFVFPLGPCFQLRDNTTHKLHTSSSGHRRPLHVTLPRDSLACFTHFSRLYAKSLFPLLRLGR